MPRMILHLCCPFCLHSAPSLVTSSVSAVIVILARQTRIFNVELPVEVDESVTEINRNSSRGPRRRTFRVYLRDKIVIRFKSRTTGRSNGAFQYIQFNLELSIHRLQLKYAEIDEKRNTAGLAVAQISEAERLVRQTIRCGLPLIDETSLAAAPDTDTRQDGVRWCAIGI
ncbi:hypothetical protein B0H19DRAFT_1055130 [Mycena capillaripes]|nr:hypothetical protein B0H19DRAFT_1055130 [Mycena capillaripes]